MKIYEFNPEAMPGDLLQAIGLYMACSAAAENAVDLAIATLLGVDDFIGATVTTHMRNRERIGALRSLAEERIQTPLAREKLTNLALELDKAFERRNAIAHNQLALDAETGQVYSVKQTARKGLDAKLAPVATVEIIDEALALNALGQSLIGLLGVTKLGQRSQ